MKCFVFITLIVFLHKSIAYFKLDDMDFRFNEKFVNASLTWDNSHPDYTSINFTLIPLLNVTTMKGSLLLVGSAYSEQVKYRTPRYECDREIIKGSVDLCRIGEMQGSMIAKVLMENFAKSANFDLRCPIKAMNYTITNLK